MLKISNFKRQSGISLLEVLLSLSIIAIILIMATRYFFVASNNDKMNTTVSQVGALIAAAHIWKGANSNYSVDGTSINLNELSDAGQLTNFPGFNKSGSGSSATVALSTMWGGTISIQPKNNLAEIIIDLPNPGSCHAILRAYPKDESGNINAACADSTFTYIFP